MYFFSRVTEVSRWQDVLEQCLLSVKKEIAKLREEKAATERELESLGVHLNTVADCIRQRDRRYGSDLVLMDEGDVELKNVSDVFIHMKVACFHSDVSLLECDTMQ
jgi:tektin-2